MILAIDPGIHGAIALFDGRSEPTVWDVERDVSKLSDFFHELPFCELVVIEDVHSMPHDGHVGAFSFGRVFGRLEALAHGQRTKIVYKRPEVWKGALGLTSNKGDTKEWCRRIGWRAIAKRRHDVREAACLAYYGLMLGV